jgi:hypothetical protein
MAHQTGAGRQAQTAFGAQCVRQAGKREAQARRQWLVLVIVHAPTDALPGARSAAVY